MSCSIKKIITLGLFFLLSFVGTSQVYALDATTQKQADQLVRQINKKLASLPSTRSEKLKVLIHNRLVELQNTFIGKASSSALQKNALYESVRRGLLEDSFDTQGVIFDDGVGAIWTQAPQGFGILYHPVSTPTISTLAAGTKNPLINGSYFSRKDGTQYHAGLLWSRGVVWSEMVYGDPQITHIVCLDTHNRITFWPNSAYFDGLMDACESAFQAGPMIYSLQDGLIEENLSSNTYIGRAHNRTVLVVFEYEGQQDIWFLTLIKPATLTDVRNTVLRESRFRGLYDTLSIFNLDGGSSVAHRNPDHPELNFGSSKALPVVFEIYK